MPPKKRAKKATPSQVSIFWTYVSKLYLTVISCNCAVTWEERGSDCTGSEQSSALHRTLSLLTSLSSPRRGIARGTADPFAECRPAIPTATAAQCPRSTAARRIRAVLCTQSLNWYHRATSHLVRLETYSTRTKVSRSWWNVRTNNKTIQRALEV